MSGETYDGIKVPELSSEDLLTGDEMEMREKIQAVIDKRVGEVIKKDELTPERKGAMDDAMKGFAIFGDEDEDIRDYAAELLKKEVGKLGADAGEADVKAAAERVSRKVAKLKVAKNNDQQPPAGDGMGGPLPSEGGSAAASHTVDAPPRNIEEAEALADKIAAEF